MAGETIPFYRVQGTHYECAHQIGTICRQLIIKRIDDDREYLKPLFDYVQTPEGLELHRGFVDVIQKTFPWYWDEIRGLTDGSGVPLEQILVLNFENETQTAYQLYQAAKTHEPMVDETGAKGCSTVLINRLDTNTLSVLHNEDNTIGLYHTGYLIEADIKTSFYNDGQRESPREKFVAYCYAGVIPGIAFGVNLHGFLYGLNALYPNFVGKNRIPRVIINRALLSIENEVQLDALLKTTPIAYGFCINGAFLNRLDQNKSYLLNYELGPSQESDENFISKCLVLNSEQENTYKSIDPDQVTMAKNYLNHFNHYERCNGLIVERETLLWSRNRGRRSLEIGEIRTVDEAMNLLGDRTDEKYPIFFVGGTTEFNLATLCTIHFNLHTRQLSIYRDNPKGQKNPKLVFNLDDLSKMEFDQSQN